ncbi:MAG: septum formation initiator family protein [Acidobacteriota bacterium]
MAAVAWGWWRGTLNVRESRRELDELARRRTELVERNRRLAREVRALQQEREAKVRAARESLDVAGREEVLVIVPTPTANAERRP